MTDAPTEYSIQRASFRAASRLRRYQGNTPGSERIAWAAAEMKRNEATAGPIRRSNRGDGSLRAPHPAGLP